jgi:hypothetical protein
MSQLLLTIFLFSVVTLLDTNEVFFCHGSDNFTTSTVSAYHTKPAHTRFYDFQVWWHIQKDELLLDFYES